MELSVGNIEPAGLEVDVESGEGLDPDQVVKDHGRVGVVSAVMELCHNSAGILKVVIFLSDLSFVFLVLHPHGFGEVSERGGVCQVEIMRAVVRQDPGKYWIL